MAKRPTEEELGLGPTAEEVEALQRPAPVEDAEYPEGGADDDADDSHQLVVKKPDGRKTRPHAEDGTFLPKTEPVIEAKAGDPVVAPPAIDDRKVDLRALQEARAENKVLMERMTTLLEIQQRKEAKANAPEADLPPDRTIDPLGRQEWLESRIDKIEGETKAQQEARQAAEREGIEFQEVLAVAMPEFNEAKAADPTVEPTYAALLENMAKELAYVNNIPTDGTATPQQRSWLGQEMTKLENSHIRYAVQTRQNVPQYMLNLAKVRNVVAPTAQQQPQTQQPAQRTIADRQASQQRHMSLGALPGSAAPSTVSAKDIAKMSQKEFNAFAAKLGDKELDKLFLQA